MAAPAPRRRGLALLILLLLPSLAWFPPTCRLPDRAVAVVAADRSGHLLDRPFPSDELVNAQGFVVLDGFPVAGSAIGQLFMGGWTRQVAESVRGFSAMTPIYFGVDRDPGLDGSYASGPGDAVQLLSLDSSHRVPVRVRFLADARGDPYLRDRLLVITPDERVPLRSGERYACVVLRRFVARAPGWEPPAALPSWLGLRAGVGTVFRVQDPLSELAALRAAADAAVAADPTILEEREPFREVSGLRYEQGTTPSGLPATIEIVEFEDGGEERTFLNDVSGAPPNVVDIAGGPTRVFQATLTTLSFQDPAGRPYQSPGLGILSDTGRSDGWIAFAADGSLVDPVPVAEPMRVVLQVPRAATARRIVVWAHGSGGDAYEAVQRRRAENDLREIRTRLADRGAVVLSADQPLFGQRFPLIDQGYETNLAVVNVPNLPAFRAAMQQGAIDQHLLLRFARERLTDALAELGEGAGLDPRRLGLFGHSIGAQIAGVAAALHQDGGPRRLLINGTSGFQTHSVLASDLFELTGIAETIFLLAGVPVPEDPTPERVLGALFGVPPEAWGGIDRFHPLGIPFQLVIDGGDPLPVAASHPIPIDVFQGDGDSKVPVDGPGWIADASRDGTLLRCSPATPYDGHFCVFREEAGSRAFERLADAL